MLVTKTGEFKCFFTFRFYARLIKKKEKETEINGFAWTSENRAYIKFRKNNPAGLAKIKY